LKYNKPPDRQVEELLDHLPKRGKNAFKLFCEALIATDQEDIVHSYLTHKENGAQEVEGSLASSVSEHSSVPASPLPAQSGDNLAGNTLDIATAGGGREVAVETSLSSLTSSSSSSSGVAVRSSLTGSFVTQPATVSPAQPCVPLSQPSPAKRRPEPEQAREDAENEDNEISRFAGETSETDSCPVKRLRPEAVAESTSKAQSVICIGGGGGSDNVIKIYNAASQADTSYSSSPLIDTKSVNVFKSTGVVAQESGGGRGGSFVGGAGDTGDYRSVGKTKSDGVGGAVQSSECAHPSGGCYSTSAMVESGARPTNPGKNEEQRYTLKHFILTEGGQESGQEANVRLAANLLSDLPRQYLDLFSTKAAASPIKVRGADMDFSQQLIRERLSRCDSTGVYKFYNLLNYENSLHVRLGGNCKI
jgi:hypothetical protein